MVRVILDEHLAPHLRAIWGYLRVGFAVCIGFFVAGGIVALIQGGRVLPALLVCFAVLVCLAFAAAEASSAPMEPPVLAVWLLKTFMPARLRKAAADDLHQAFTEMAAKASVSAARAWYWSQVARSLPHVLGLGPLRALAQVLAVAASMANLFLR